MRYAEQYKIKIMRSGLDNYLAPENFNHDSNVLKAILSIELSSALMLTLLMLCISLVFIIYIVRPAFWSREGSP